MFTDVAPVFQTSVFNEEAPLRLRPYDHGLWSHAELPNFQAGDVWWCSMETAAVHDPAHPDVLKSECRRPVLILKKFGKNTFLGLQVTKQDKGGNWYVPVQFAGKRRFVMLHRPIALGVERLTDREGWVDDVTLVRVREQFLGLYSY